MTQTHNHKYAFQISVSYNEKEIVQLHSTKFYICGSVHRNSRLKKSKKIQQYADIYLLLNYSTCFGRPSRPSSGVHKPVVAASGTDRTVWEASFFKGDRHVSRSLLPRQYDLYQGLQLQFYALLIMGAMDARNM